MPWGRWLNRFLPPTGTGATIGFVVLHGAKPAWIWPMVVPAMLLAWWTMRRNLIGDQPPKKRERESLRAKLLDESA